MSKNAFLFLVLLILSFNNFLLACGGSCLVCHPKLQQYINDNNHSVLKECVICHNKPAERGQCGKDCFDCHPKERIYAQRDVMEHQELKKCSQCHEEKANFNMQKPSISSPQQEYLIHILK